MVLPFLNPSFQDRMWLFPKQTQIPMCTVANLPRKPEHCVAYAMMIAWDHMACLCSVGGWEHRLWEDRLCSRRFGHGATRRSSEAAGKARHAKGATPAEVLEYGDWLGMDRDGHRHLMWIAREALKAPLPEHWKLCQSPTEDLFYFHFKSGQSSWDHPSDVSFQALFQRYKDTPAPTVACEADDAASSPRFRLSQVMAQLEHLVPRGVAAKQVKTQHEDMIHRHPLHRLR